MKTRLAYLKEILFENKEDLMYLFFVGLPSGILMILISPCMDYTHLPPSNPTDDYSVLPIQIFNWISRPQAAFQTNAAAGIIVLLIVTFLLNGIVILYRNRLQSRYKW